MASAMFVWAAAALLWFWNGVTRDHVFPFPSVADIGFVGYAIPAGAALLAFPREDQPLVSRTRSAVDGLLIAVSVLFVSWATVLASLAQDAGEGLAAITALSYPIADVLISSLVLVLVLRRPPQARLMWVLMGSGLLVLSVTDSVFVSLITAGKPTIGTPLQAGWVACFLLIAVATIIPDRSRPHRSRHFTVDRELLPYLPVLAAIVVVSERDQPITPSTPFLFWNGVLLVGLVFVHQIVLALEKIALADNLEARVQERTSELVSSRNEAVTASQAKSEFLTTMSHEIRTPLNGVIGLSGLLLDGELGEKERRYAEGVQGAGSALLVIINDILDFSKIEAGMMELETVDFSLERVIEETAELMAQEAHGKGVELLASCDPDVPPLLRGDPSRVRQVLLNLTANAVKFTNEGEVVIGVHLVDSTTEGATVRLEVTDTGIGISDADRPRLFEPFSQADASTTRRFGGTGLGLAICRQLVTAMGGALGVDSEPGRGSTFWFTLPVGTADEESGSAPHPDGHLAGLRVLVVDDNSTNRSILTEQLGACGMRPEAVVDGPAAIAALDDAVAGADPYPVVLLDMCMPGVNGLEVARRIRANSRHADTKLLLLTSATDVAPGEAQKAGISRVLTKPIPISRLCTALQGTHIPGRNGEAPQQSPAQQPAGSLGHVLVVEDNRVNQMVAGGMLHKLGYTCELAGDGVEALAALERRSFSAVLMDCQMPRMDGYEATRAIRSRSDESAAIPVIAMTASATHEGRDKCLAVGMNDFIPKPVDLQVLANALERWVSDHDPQADPPTQDDADRPMPGHDGVDVLDLSRLDTLVALTPGDTAFLDRLVASWLESAPQALEQIRHAISADAGDQLIGAAHRLKGSAATLGAHRVAAVCEDLELIGESGHLQAAPDEVVKLSRELELAMQAMRAHRATSQANERPPQSG